MSDFNLDQLIAIVNKTKICFEVNFDSGLVTARQNCTLQGYLSTFHEFVENLKDAATNKPSAVPVFMNDFEPAVEQLWDEVKDVIEAVNTYRKPFLKLFGVEKGNGK